MELTVKIDMTTASAVLVERSAFVAGDTYNPLHFDFSSFTPAQIAAIDLGSMSLVLRRDGPAGAAIASSSAFTSASQVTSAGTASDVPRVRNTVLTLNLQSVRDWFDDVASSGTAFLATAFLELTDANVTYAACPVPFVLRSFAVGSSSTGYYTRDEIDAFLAAKQGTLSAAAPLVKTGDSLSIAAATKQSFGAVKVGDRISVSNGVISADAPVTDSALDASSVNPIQNKPVAEAVAGVTTRLDAILKTVDGTETGRLKTAETKLATIADGAEVNVQSDWNQSDATADDYIKNKPTIPVSVRGSMWFTSSTISGSEATLTGDYIVGDIILATESYDVYRVTSVTGTSPSVTATASKVGNIKGDVGAAGARGASGAVVKTYSSVAAAEQAHDADLASGAVKLGELVLVSSADADNGKMYRMDSAAYTYLAQVKGSDGTDGEHGTRWFTGSAAPDEQGYFPDSAMDGARVGDLYLRTADGYVYVCDTAASGSVHSKWSYRCSIHGEDGDDGEDGTVWFTGSAAPSETGYFDTADYDTANVGDLYLRTTNGDVYSCTEKASVSVRSKWAYKCSLKGASGTNGANGTKWFTGTSAPDQSGHMTVAGASVGDLYLRTTNGYLYSCTSVSTETPVTYTWAYKMAVNPPFVGATSTTAGTSGMVPAPGTGDRDKFLKADGSWSEFASPDFGPATESSSGTQGLVPAPGAGSPLRILTANAGWADPNYVVIDERPENTPPGGISFTIPVWTDSESERVLSYGGFKPLLSNDEYPTGLESTLNSYIPTFPATLDIANEQIVSLCFIRGTQNRSSGTARYPAAWYDSVTEGKTNTYKAAVSALLQDAPVTSPGVIPRVSWNIRTSDPQGNVPEMIDTRLEDAAYITTAMSQSPSDSNILSEKGVSDFVGSVTGFAKPAAVTPTAGSAAIADRSVNTFNIATGSTYTLSLPSSAGTRAREFYVVFVQNGTQNATSTVKFSIPTGDSIQVHGKNGIISVETGMTVTKDVAGNSSAYHVYHFIEDASQLWCVNLFDAVETPSGGSGGYSKVSGTITHQGSFALTNSTFSSYGVTPTTSGEIEATFPLPGIGTGAPVDLYLGVKNSSATVTAHLALFFTSTDGFADSFGNSVGTSSEGVHMLTRYVTLPPGGTYLRRFFELNGKLVEDPIQKDYVNVNGTVASGGTYELRNRSYNTYGFPAAGNYGTLNFRLPPTQSGTDLGEPLDVHFCLKGHSSIDTIVQFVAPDLGSTFVDIWGNQLPGVSTDGDGYKVYRPLDQIPVSGYTYIVHFMEAAGNVVVDFIDRENQYIDEYYPFVPYGTVIGTNGEGEEYKTDEVTPYPRELTEVDIDGTLSTFSINPYNDSEFYESNGLYEGYLLVTNRFTSATTLTVTTDVPLVLLPPDVYSTQGGGIKDLFPPGTVTMVKCCYRMDDNPEYEDSTGDDEEEVFPYVCTYMSFSVESRAAIPTDW